MYAHGEPKEMVLKVAIMITITIRSIGGGK